MLMSHISRLVPGAPSKISLCQRHNHGPQHQSHAHMTPIRLLKKRSGSCFRDTFINACQQRQTSRPYLASRASQTEAPSRTLAPQWKQRAPKFLAAMFLLGSTVGPAVDGIHGQVHLVPIYQLLTAVCIYISTCACAKKACRETYLVSQWQLPAMQRPHF